MLIGLAWRGRRRARRWGPLLVLFGLAALPLALFPALVLLCLVTFAAAPSSTRLRPARSSAGTLVFTLAFLAALVQAELFAGAPSGAR